MRRSWGQHILSVVSSTKLHNACSKFFPSFSLPPNTKHSASRAIIVHIPSTAQELLQQLLSAASLTRTNSSLLPRGFAAHTTFFYALSFDKIRRFSSLGIPPHFDSKLTEFAQRPRGLPCHLNPLPKREWASSWLHPRPLLTEASWDPKIKSLIHKFVEPPPCLKTNNNLA